MSIRPQAANARTLRTLVVAFSVLLSLWVVVWLLQLWQDAGVDNSLVVYFARPLDIWNQFYSEWPLFLRCSLTTFITATAALILSIVLARVSLALALRSGRSVFLVERVAVLSQAIPMLAIVTILMLIEQAIARMVSLEFVRSLPAFSYVLLPVTISLYFPAFLAGVKAYEDAPVELRILERTWAADRKRAIQEIFMPISANAFYAGVAVSSTWAVIATLIAEGMVNGVSGSDSTLGHYLLVPFNARTQGQTPAFLLVVSILGLCMYLATRSVSDWYRRRIYGNVGEHQQLPFTPQE